jgi:hypothetical protein
MVVGPLLACLDNPKFRFPGPVLEALGNLVAKEAVPYYIRFLRHPDPHIRGIARNALRVATHKAMGFSATADEAKREAAVKKWEQWWAENKDAFTAGGAAPAGPKAARSKGPPQAKPRKR